MATTSDLDKSTSELKASDAAYTAARGSLASAERRLKELQDYNAQTPGDVSPERLAQQEAKVAAARAQVEATGAAYQAANDNWKKTYDEIPPETATPTTPVQRAQNIKTESADVAVAKEAGPQPQTFAADPPATATATPTNVEPPTLTQADVVPLSDQEADALAAQQEENQKILAREATDVEPGGTGYSVPVSDLNGMSLDPNASSVGDIQSQVGVRQAQDQQALSSSTGQTSSNDWRVIISLASGASYLNSGILQPLVQAGGVIFPYTPVIETTYRARYDTVDLVHSNYRGYFYKSSSPEEVTVRGTFTAQDSSEAAYLLAVIHFFRSVTKMFYGQDGEAGTPPPVVFLSAYGQYQFNRHPCVVTNFNYVLPQDVDYIRADGFNSYGLNLENRRPRRSGPGQLSLTDFIKSRLQINGLFPGGLPNYSPQSAVDMNVSNTGSGGGESTYVPSKMEISVNLLPMQTRDQVSQQFSLRDFASGELLTRGFW